MRPRLLDLFCGAGGCSVGYARAGFDVYGVDINPQPNYPFPFTQWDALEYPLDEDHWDVIHASVPCQDYSTTKALHDNEHPRLVEPMRELLEASGAAYVIECVVGAPLIDAVRLCGSSFGLGVRRHRLFEVRPLLIGVPPCAHYLQPLPLDVTGTGGPGGRHRKPRNMEEANKAMGIDWMTRNELVQAIPPAYTQWVGEQLLSALVWL